MKVNIGTYQSQHDSVIPIMTLGSEVWTVVLCHNSTAEAMFREAYGITHITSLTNNSLCMIWETD